MVKQEVKVIWQDYDKNPNDPLRQAFSDPKITAAECTEMRHFWIKIQKNFWVVIPRWGGEHPLAKPNPAK